MGKNNHQPVYVNLDNLIVRPIKPEEEKRWNDLLRTYHYLSIYLTGKTPKYVAILNGHWVALIGWGSVVYECGNRDRWLGWTEDQKNHRLKFIANNQRYLILRISNLASKALALNLRGLSSDWEAVHAPIPSHPLCPNIGRAAPFSRHLPQNWRLGGTD
ncbi:hypothetical protein J2Z49_000662 [Desulfofundulus luciae]|uniref:DUF4338 domain-containing protein n=1 Tax=Desulfofundulus luciae TaxID=74702 RepID=A0ABU0AZ68_9FIRM|nr:Druantia anti-phage system protein DruA [Desulfofundulus luciae]MDQ0285558.1 hypothetical protein [Desulfofundulus luciae]